MQDNTYEHVYLGDGGSPAPWLVLDGAVYVLTTVHEGRNATYNALSDSLVWEVER